MKTLSSCLQGLDLKKSITNHHELRQRSSLDCSSPQITDQSYKNACDINNIMANYVKTGMLPQTNSSEPRYVDNTLIPSLEIAHNVIKQAQDAFQALPPYIRKLMDNDPSKLESFISDPENTHLLIKYGLATEKIQEKTTNSEINTTTIQKSETNL